MRHDGWTKINVHTDKDIKIHLPVIHEQQSNYYERKGIRFRMETRSKVEVIAAQLPFLSGDWAEPLSTIVCLL